MPEPKPDDVTFHEETDSPTYADDRNFYKVEKWTRDGTKVDSLLCAGSSLGRARSVFELAIKHRPRIRLTTGSAHACSINGRPTDARGSGSRSSGVHQGAEELDRGPGFSDRRGKTCLTSWPPAAGVSAIAATASAASLPSGIA
jgi:hypothetical protein